MQISVIGSSVEHGEMYGMAYELGKMLASMGHIVVNGGRGGIMEGVSKGASEAGGTVIGILPSDGRHTGNGYLTAEVPTGIGDMRNFMVVHAGDVLVAFPGSYGTTSELSYGLLRKKRIIIFMPERHGVGVACAEEDNVTKAHTLHEVLEQISEYDDI